MNFNWKLSEICEYFQTQTKNVFLSDIRTEKYTYWCLNIRRKSRRSMWRELLVEWRNPGPGCSLWKHKDFKTTVGRTKRKSPTEETKNTTNIARSTCWTNRAVNVADCQNWSNRNGLQGFRCESDPFGCFCFFCSGWGEELSQTVFRC